MRRFHSLALLAAVSLSPVATSVSAQAAPANNVILVMTDGLRWQELFGGADAAMMGRAGGGDDSVGLSNKFWRESADARRTTLMPFIWGTMATRGQIFGDSTVGSTSVVTNPHKFSYPGYSETFTGHVDPRIDSNEHPPNENRTVFEWLNHQPQFKGRVAAFATWGVFRNIINAERSGVPVYDGWDNGSAPTGTARATVLRDLYATTTRLWSNNAFDALTHQATLDYIATRRTRVLFVGYGETDEWAHSGRYDRYLKSAHQVDAFLADLWRRAQADPATRNRTTLIVTTDHGRGWAAKWRDHGKDVIGAERIWIAVMGPGIPAAGVRRDTPTTQSQVAATVAAALGLDWTKAEPKAAKPLPIFGAP